jgi:hypothetical protein
MVPITYVFFHYMVPVLDVVKAEIGESGTEKRDYRNLLHNSFLCFLPKKKAAVEATLLHVMGLSQPIYYPSSPIGRFCET